MSEERFLGRWSRRKREAASRRQAPTIEAQAEAAQPAVPQDSPPLTAPENLPPVDAIDAATDIRGFLAEGVPAGVSRAALRRAWASDPSICDFIGLSENAWDFTAPDGVPGFGAVTTEDIRRLLAQADEAPAASPESDAAAPAGNAPDAAAPAGVAAGAEKPAPPEERGAEASGAEASPPPSPRRHGGALPR